MKKQNSSIKKRNAANKRGKKRTQRLKKTQEEKFIRVNAVKKRHEKDKKEKILNDYKFQQHLNSLMPPELM